MSALADIIKDRRSIRKYEDKPVSDEAIARILEAVQWSPSWTNCQPWEVIIVKDASVKEKLQAVMARAQKSRNQSDCECSGAAGVMRQAQCFGLL